MAAGPTLATLGLRIDGAESLSTVRAFGETSERAGKQGDALEQSVRRTNQSLGGFKQAGSEATSIARHLVEAFAAYKAVEWANQTLELAARYETLGVVMDVVGRNAGKTSNEMLALEHALEKTGISMIESRNNLARMAGAQIDLANATGLARIAQDAAVISNKNSSEAFEDLITGISTGQTRILRTLGIFVDLDQAHQKYAATLHKNADDLSEFERTQANANAVLSAGARIAGTYEAAMETAGKQIKSAERYLEDVRVKAGEAFSPAHARLVFLYADALKTLGQHATATAAALGSIAAIGIGAGLVKVLAGTGFAAGLSLATTTTASFSSAAALAGAATVGWGAAFAGVAGGIATVLGPIALLGAAGALAVSAMNKLFDEHAEKVEEASKNTKEYVAYLKALGRESARWGFDPSKSGGEVTPVPTGGGTSKHADEVRQLIREQSLEVEKLAALNAAFHGTELQQKLLGIEYDRQTERAKHATETDATLRAGLDRLSDAKARELGIAARLADQQAQANALRAEEDRLIEARLAKAASVYDAIEKIQQARTESDLLYAAMGNGTQAYQEQADLIETLNALTAAGINVTDAAYAATKRDIEITREQNRAIKEQQQIIENVRSSTSGTGNKVKDMIRELRETQDAIAQREADYQAGQEKEWLRGWQRITSGGLESFSKFFDEVGRMFANLMAKMIAAGKDSGFGFGALKLGAAAINGGFAGYAAGQQIGSAGGGALGGAAAGALAGSEFGVPGAFIGGLVGLTTGLIGGAKAAEQRAAAEAELSRQLELSLNTIRRQVGVITDLQAAIAQTTSDFSKLRGELAVRAFGENLFGQNKTGDGKYTQELKELGQLEAQRIQQLKDEAAAIEAAKLADFRRSITEQFNALDGPAGAYRNQLDAIERTYQQSIATAKQLGIAGDDLTQIEEIRTRGLKALADAQEAVNRTEQQGLQVRLARARGNGGQADDLAFYFAQIAEMEDAVKRGLSQQTIHLLTIVQAAEREDRARRQDAERQIAIAEAQLSAAQAQAQALQEQIGIQERAVEETRRVFERLSDFAKGLSLNTALTTLSPIAQLAEARRQYDEQYTKAAAGDRTAATGLPDIAQRYLEASRAVNASGPGYVSDFDRVQHQVSALRDLYGNSLSVEEQTLAELRSQSALLQQQIAALQAQINYLQQIASNTAAPNIPPPIISPKLPIDPPDHGFRPAFGPAAGGSSGGNSGGLPPTVYFDQGPQIAVLQAGFTLLVDRVETLTSTVEDQTATMKRSLEDVQLAS